MAEMKTVTYHRRANWALDEFEPEVQHQVRGALKKIAAQKSVTGSPVVARFSDSRSMYILRATPEIRVIFRTSGDAIEVLDVVKSATLDSFSRIPSTSDHPAPKQEGSTSSHEAGAKAEQER